MATIRIKVGASVDASVAAVFETVAKASEKATRRVSRDFGTTVPAAMKKGADKGASDASRATDSYAKHAESSADAIAKHWSGLFRAQADGAKRTADEQIKEAKRVSKEIEAELKKTDQARKSWVNSTVGKAGANISFAARAAIGLGRTVASGMGVDMSVGSQIQSSVRRQHLSTIIANEGYIEGASGAAGKRQDPNAIGKESISIAKDIGGSAEEIQEGLRKFVGFTGDLETGRAVMRDMAKISVGMGASMEDVQTAAGKISKQLGDVPNKADKINTVMLKLAAMGKIGAAPIESFAAELSKLAPMAGKVGGGAKGTETMATLMQLAQAGGAKGASQASTAAVRFVDSLTKGPTAKAWAAQGLDPFTDKTKQQVREPLAIMLDVLRSTHGNQTKISKLFTSQPAKQVLEPLLQAYIHAGGGKVGSTKEQEGAALKAATEAYHQLSDATQSHAALEKDLANVQKDTANKVERFNAKLQEVADHTMEKLLPALERMAPEIEKAADAFAKLLEWASENPGKAITAAIVGSIAKAGLETTLRSGFQQILTSLLGKGGIGSVAGVGGSGMLAGGAIAGATGYAAGVYISDKLVGAQANAARGQTANALSGINAAMNETDQAKLEDAIQAQKKNVAGAKSEVGAVHFTDALMTAIGVVTGQKEGVDQAINARQDESKRNAELQLQVLQQMEKHLAALKAQGGTVRADTTSRSMAGPGGNN